MWAGPRRNSISGRQRQATTEAAAAGRGLTRQAFISVCCETATGSALVNGGTRACRGFIRTLTRSLTRSAFRFSGARMISAKGPQIDIQRLLGDE